MKYLVLVAMLVAAFAQQPAKAPEGKRAPESDSAQSTAHAKSAESNQAASEHLTPVPTQDSATQRKLTWFTAVLAGVGVLQLVVMFLTWQVYRRQAREMRRQRHVMYRQWKAMRAQLSQMESAGEQTAELIKHAGNQVAALSDSAQAARETAEAARISAMAGENNALAASANASALINSERAWVMVDIRWTADMRATSVPRPTTMKLVNHSGSTSIDVCLVCNNDGRTPAWITDKRILFRIVTSIPKPPPTGSLFEVGKDDFFTYGPEPLGVGEESIEQPHFLKCDGTFEPGKILLVYGHVKYRDIFSPKRETRFGYMSRDGKTLVRIPDLRVNLPALGADDDFWDYNSYT